MPTNPTSITEAMALREELATAAINLRALERDQKIGMEKATGFSANALAILLTQAEVAIASLSTGSAGGV